MSKADYTKIKLSFKTERMSISPILTNREDAVDLRESARELLGILTPRVRRYLPDSWQSISSEEEALRWKEERELESSLFSVRLLSDESLIGLIIIYEEEDQNNNYDLMFGYLLSEEVWGKSYGSELIRGLVDSCLKLDRIKSLSGGVARDNIPSIKILEKCGFKAQSSDDHMEDTIIFKMDL